MFRICVFFLVTLFTRLIRWKSTRKWAIDVLNQWATSKSDTPMRIRYEVAWQMQAVISQITGYSICTYCHKVEMYNKPHEYCIEQESELGWKEYFAVQEAQNQIEQEQFDREWEEYIAAQEAQNQIPQKQIDREWKKYFAEKALEERYKRWH